MSNDTSPHSVHWLVRGISNLWLTPRRLWLRRRLDRPVIERVAGRYFLVAPNVFNPVIFRTGRYLADFIRAQPHADPATDGTKPTALDVGTGCGIHAVFAADRGYRVDAVDISQDAIDCARINLALNGCRQDVSLHQGDLFAPVAGRRFDLVLCSLPKFRGRPGSAFEISWRSADVIDRFAAALPGALKPGGMALVLLTSHGDESGMLDALRAAGLVAEIAEQKHFGVEKLTVYRVSHRPPETQDAGVG